VSREWFKKSIGTVALCLIMIRDGSAIVGDTVCWKPLFDRLVLPTHATTIICYCLEASRNHDPVSACFYACKLPSQLCELYSEAAEGQAGAG
jgi:hypothetical protein